MSERDDSSREFLLTKFVCTECGRNLHIRSGPVPPGRAQYSQGEPTGADHTTAAIAIYPCRCQREQVDEVRAAARVLVKAAQQDIPQ